MKRLVTSLAVAAVCALLITPAVYAQANQVIPGTQIRMTLVSGLSTTVAHKGDPFTAVVAEPVAIGNQIVLPAGTKVHGEVTDVIRPRYFSMFRGGASINLVFKSVEIESRIFPVQMSILALYADGPDMAKKRKDLNTVEGVVIQEKHDIKTAAMTVAVGTSGGSLVGAIFSNVGRGTVIGLVGSSAYVMAKKGKEIELPAQTGLLVRMDSTLALPSGLLHNASYTTSGE
jgi:hypothetical protein